MAFPTDVQHKGAARTTAGTTLAITPTSPTAAGSRLILLVGTDPNQVDGITITPPAGFSLVSPPGRVVRQATGHDAIVIAAYEKLNAAAQSAALTVGFSAPIFANVELLEVTGDDNTVAAELQNSAVGSGLALTVPSPGTPTRDCLAISYTANGNPASNQTQGAGWTVLDNVESGSTGIDRIRTVASQRTVAAGAACPANPFTIDGVTNRNLAGLIILVPTAGAVVTPSGVRQVVAAANPGGAATTLDVDWDRATVAGNRLLLAVAASDQNTLTTVVPPAGWVLLNPPNKVQRDAAGLHVLSLALYEKRAAASESGTVSVGFSGKASYFAAAVIEVTNSDESVALDVQATATGSAQLLTSGGTAATTATDEIAIAAIANLNKDVQTVHAGNAFTQIAQAGSGGSASGAKVNLGIYSLPVALAGVTLEAQVDVGGGFNHSYAGLIITLKTAGSTGGGGGGGGGGGPIGGSPYFPNTDDGSTEHNQACSIHYYGSFSIADIPTAQAMADRYLYMVGTGPNSDSATGGDFKTHAPDIKARRPACVLAFYGKSAQSTKGTTYYPTAYYAHTAGGGLITTFSSSIYVMQPDSTGSFADPTYPFTASGWKNWRGREAWRWVANENGRWGTDPMKGMYLDSMGTSSYKGTQVKPGTNVVYTQAEWVQLVRTIGDEAMRLKPDSSYVVLGNGLIAGSNYFTANPPAGGLLDHVDAGIAENWIHNNYSSVNVFPTESSWQKAIDSIIDANVNRRKGYWAVVNIANNTAGNPPAGWVTPTPAQLDRWYKLAAVTFLLGNRGAAVLEFVENAPTVLPLDADHPYMHLNLGSPLTYALTAVSMKTGGAMYVREFADGIAMTNYLASGNATYTLARQATVVQAETVIVNGTSRSLAAGATIASGATITLGPNTALAVQATHVDPPNGGDTGGGGGGGTTNTGGPTITKNVPASSVDSATQTASFGISDPDGISPTTPPTLKLNGGAPVTLLQSGSVWVHDVVLTEGVNTLEVTATDNHASPLAATTAFSVTYAPASPVDPVPPVVVGTPALGCGVYQVKIFTRGAGFIVLDVPWQSLDWSRILDDTGEAHVTIAQTGLSSCCGQLANMGSYEYELHLYRDNARIWLGPLVQVEFPEGGLTATLTGRDVSGWLDRRRIHEDHVYATPHDLVTIWHDLIEDAMAPDPSPAISDQVKHGVNGPSGVRNYLKAQHLMAGETLRELARSGIDWTVIERVILGSDDGTMVGDVLPLILDEHLSAVPRVLLPNGKVNSWGVGGQGGGDTGDVVWGTYTDAAGVTRDGLLEGVDREDTILTNADAKTAAKSRTLLTADPSPYVTDMTLDPKAPILIEDLYPGKMADLRLTTTCIPIAQHTRITKVSGAATAEGAEAITMSVQPPGLQDDGV